MPNKLSPVIGVVDDAGSVVGLVHEGVPNSPMTPLGSVTADSIADALETAVVEDPASVARVQALVSGDVIDAAWYGLAQGNTAAANQSALLAFRAAIAAASTTTGRVSAVIRPGTYNVAPTVGAEPNWAIKNLDLDASAATFISATDAPVFLADGGRADAVNPQSLAGVFGANLRFGRVIAPAVGATGAAVRVTKTHGGLIEGEVAQTDGIGFDIGFCVLSTLKPTISVHRGNFGGVSPEIGVLLRSDPIVGDAGTASYISVVNPIIEGCKKGAVLQAALGCGFYGGAIEANSDIAVTIAGASQHNKFFGVDFEANPAGDFVINGDYTGIIECDTMTSIISNGAYTNLVGGLHDVVTLGAASLCNDIQARYNRSGTGGIFDTGTKNSYSKSRDVSAGWTGRRYNRYNYTPSGGSFVYQNASGDMQYFAAVGGTNLVMYTTFGSADAPGPGVDPNGTLPVVPGASITLMPGQNLELVWSTAPSSVVVWR